MLGLFGGLTLLLPNLAFGASIGLNFVRGPGADVENIANGAANALAPADEAGAPGYVQPNWNNLGRRGTNIALVNSSGAATTVTVSWAATNNWSVLGGGNPAAAFSPDGNLMNCYLDSNNNGNTAVDPNLYAFPNGNWPLLYFSGLSAWLTAEGVGQYDVVIYSDGDNQAGRTGEYWIQAASGSAESMTVGADLTTRVFLRDYNNFQNNAVYQEVPATSLNGRVAGSGNYTVIKGLSADSFLIRTAEFNTRVPINAIQIVPRATAAGATLAPLAGSQTFAGGRATFRVTAAGVLPIAYQWRKGATPLTDGGNLSGTTTSTLVISGVSAADQGDYSVVVSNASGIVTSTVAPLVVLTPAGDSYAEKVFTNNPVAYWRLNETADPSLGDSPAYDYAGGFHGIYGPLAQNGYLGTVGPQPAEFPGFEANNYALRTIRNTTTPILYPSSYISWVVAPPLNLNTNTVTVCAWIYPIANQTANTAILSARGADVNTFGWGNNANNFLGYTWNNGQFNFSSGLSPTLNQWSFVAWVVTPTNAIIYLYNQNGQFSATNTVDHVNVAFAGFTMIGVDPSSTTLPQDRAFNGTIDEVAVFNRALSDQELYLYYKKGLNVGLIPASVSRQPVSQALYEGRTARFSVAGAGDQPLSYQWRRNGGNLVNGGRISGANSPNLVITEVAFGDAGNYDVVLNNVAGIPATSDTVTLTVVADNPTLSPYEAALRAANPIAYWRLDETSGTVAHDYWGGNIANHTFTTVGVAGPRPPDFTGFEPANAAASYDGFSTSTETGVSYMNNRAQFAIVGWFNSPITQLARAGLFGQNDVAEFGFHGADVGIWTPGGGFASFAGQGQSMINPGQWYFVAASGNGSSLSLYLLSTNLAMQATVNAATTNYGSSTFPFRIGGGGILDGTGNHFVGEIDDVAIFDRALSASEVASLYGAAQVGGVLPPAISSQPVSTAVYPGRNARFAITAVGTEPIQYQWRKDGVNLADGGNVAGANTLAVSLTAVTAADDGDYDVIVSNAGGSVTSSVAVLTVVLPTSDYESVAVSYNPVAYWRLNEQQDPSTGTARAFDFYGSLAGTYGVASQNGFNSIAGPRPADGFSIFESSNTAVQTASGVPNSFVTVPPLGITTSNLTITVWLYPYAYVDRGAFVFARAGGAATGINFINTGELNYHWNDNAATYGWPSGLTVPLNQWSFVALVVEPSQATMYLLNAAGSRSAINAPAGGHGPRTFSDNIRIGGDPNSDARTFNGVIDEVAIFNYSMTSSDIQSLYAGVPAVSLAVQRVGDNVVLTWPRGTLLEANEVTGPYTTNNAASPYIIAPTAPRKFYQVIVK